MGIKAYPSLPDVPGEIDVVILVIPATATENAVKQCVQKQAKFVVVHGAGFSEIGAIGKELEEKIEKISG